MKKNNAECIFMLDILKKHRDQHWLDTLSTGFFQDLCPRKEKDELEETLIIH